MGIALMSNGSASCPYEIGDGFWTKNPTPPSERCPGTTWEQIKDMFLLSSGDTYSIGQTGGEAAHNITPPLPCGLYLAKNSVKTVSRAYHYLMANPCGRYSCIFLFLLYKIFVGIATFSCSADR